jgi:hypothetical protein
MVLDIKLIYRIKDYTINLLFPHSLSTFFRDYTAVAIKYFLIKKGRK